MGRGRVVVVACALAAVAAGIGGGAGAARPASTLALKGAKQQYVPGQLVVRFRANVDPLSRLEALSDESARTIRPLGLAGLQLVRVQGSVPEAARALEANPAVAYAEPNWIYHALATPNDPRYPSLWGLAKISAPAAWHVTTGSRAVKVAVVDTGITTDHPDLAGNVVGGYDFVQGDADPRDFNGHGTHVAGTIGARGNNGLGVTGVNWQVSLIPVRVLDGSGSGSNANVAAGFAYACAQGANIVNASLGGTGYSQAMRDAIASPACVNTLFVVAAGNDGVSDDAAPHYPCNYGAGGDNLPNVICVAATDQNDQLAPFSNYGRSVDLAAPGVDIESSWPAYDTLAVESFEGGVGNWAPAVVSGVPFGISTVHANGSFSIADSPSGSYANGTDSGVVRTSSFASLAGRIGCRLFYSLRLDTQPGHDYFQILGSADGVHFSGSQWSGSTAGTFVSLSSDMSAFDGSATFVPALRLLADGDGVTGDGGYLDDLALACLRPGAESYNTISGTSMATPHVTGVAALIKAAHPSYTVAQLKDTILGHTDKLASLSGKVATGGRLDACKALGCTTALKPPCVVPKVVGKRLGSASSAIRARHCRVGKVSYVKSTRKTSGKVIRQSPTPGRRLGSNARISLWVGRGH